MATATKSKKKQYTAEEKAAWKKERLEEQKQLLENALAELTSSEAWAHWVKFGRNNLRRLTLNNALLIWSQKRDATVVWGRKQWEKKGVTVNKDAQPLRYFAPAGFFVVKDKNGDPILDANGNEQKRMFYRVVTGYDVSDTDAPEPEFEPMVTLEGDEHYDKAEALEQWARELGYSVVYKPLSEMKGAHGWIDDRMWQIVVGQDLTGNAIVRTLLHEVFHVYGNVNYQDYTREVAEVLVESSTVMALGMLGFDTSEASVRYIASWGGGDLKEIQGHMKLVEELVNEATKRMGL